MYILSTAKDAPIQNYLGEFNPIIIDLKCVYVKIEDESKIILFVVSLPHSYKHFKEILLHSNNDVISFEDVKANLFSIEKFDFEVR